MLLISLLCKLSIATTCLSFSFWCGMLVICSWMKWKLSCLHCSFGREHELLSHTPPEHISFVVISNSGIIIVILNWKPKEETFSRVHNYIIPASKPLFLVIARPYFALILNLFDICGPREMKWKRVKLRKTLWCYYKIYFLHFKWMTTVPFVFGWKRLYSSQVRYYNSFTAEYDWWFDLYVLYDISNLLLLSIEPVTLGHVLGCVQHFLPLNPMHNKLNTIGNEKFNITDETNT